MDIINGYGTRITDVEDGIVTPNYEFHIMGDELQHTEQEYLVNISKAANILLTVIQNSPKTELKVQKLKTIKKKKYSEKSLEDNEFKRDLYFIK